MKNPSDSSQATRMLWYSAWFDVVLGVAALLWGDLLFPPGLPAVFGLSMGTIVGLAFLVFAAPAVFSLYYYRRARETPQRPGARAPIEKL
jgi:hypothetical protein